MNCPPLDTLYRLAQGEEEDSSGLLALHLDDCRRCQSVLERFESVSAVPVLFSTDTVSSDFTSNLQGKKLGRYVLTQLVGSGSNSLVYKALHETTKNVVAVKIVSPLSLPEERQKTWLREAKLSGKVRHKHLVRILDADQQEGFDFAVFEWMDGGTLSDRIRQNPLPPKLAAEYAMNLADACHALHESSILHRDVKPSNILLDGEGTIKLADLGVARSVEDTASLSGDAWVGTLGYLAPEQLGLIPNEQNPSTDVYGIGAVLYTMLVGHGPFAGSDQAEILSHVSKQHVTPLKRFRKLPRDLETICHKCLEYTPEHRYSSAAELAEDLRRFLEARPIRATRPSVATRVLKLSRRHPEVTVLVALLLVFLSVASWVITSQVRQSQFARATHLLQSYIDGPAEECAVRLALFQTLDSASQAAAMSTFTEANRNAPVSATHLLRILMVPNLRLPENRLLKPLRWQDLTLEELTALQTLSDSESTSRSAIAENWVSEPIKDMTDRDALMLASAVGIISPSTELPDWLLDRCVSSLTETSGMHAIDIKRRLDFARKSLGPKLHARLFTPTGKPTVLPPKEQSAFVDFAIHFLRDSEKELVDSLELASLDQMIEWANSLQNLDNPARSRVLQKIEEAWRGAFDESIEGRLLVESLRLDHSWKDSLSADSFAFPLRQWIEKGHGTIAGLSVAIPHIPYSDWPDVIRTCRDHELAVQTAKPYKFNGVDSIAVVIARSESAWDVSLDVGEEGLEQEIALRSQQGFGATSIWGRLDADAPQKLLVSIVWNQGPGEKAEILLDEAFENLPLALPPTQGLTGEIDRHWFQSLTQSPEVTSSNKGILISTSSSRDIKDDETNDRKTRTLTLRLPLAEKSGRPIGAIGIRRLQETPILITEEGTHRIVERNQRFPERAQKLWAGPVQLEEWRSKQASLHQLGFHLEDILVTPDTSGQPNVSVRWSRNPSFPESAYSKRYNLTIASLLGANNAPLIQELSAQSDQTVRTRIIATLANLPVKDWKATELIGANPDNAKLAQALLLALGNSFQISQSQDEFDRLYTSSSLLPMEDAGVFSAFLWTNNQIGTFDRTLRAISKVPRIGEVNRRELKHGQLIASKSGQLFVVIDFTDRIQIAGAENLVTLNSQANVRSVLQGKRFAIALHETTFADYGEFVKETTGESLSLPEFVPNVKCPLVEVSYRDALLYCQWLTKREGIFEESSSISQLIDSPEENQWRLNAVDLQGFRLPTGAEWEMAVRASSMTDRFFGNASEEILSYANIANPDSPTLVLVGSRKPNLLGLFDTYGNVLEMCMRRMHGRNNLLEYWKSKPDDVSVNARGGSFLTHGMYASSGSIFTIPDNVRDQNIGFRVAFTIDD